MCPVYKGMLDPTILNYSALRSNSAFRFFIFSALWLKIRPSGFITIRPSGFGLMDQFDTHQYTIKAKFKENKYKKG